MTTLFIADLHLDDARPQITELFERTLAGDEARQADALYILGDLVEACSATTTTPTCRNASPPRRARCATAGYRCTSCTATATSCWARFMQNAPA